MLERVATLWVISVFGIVSTALAQQVPAPMSSASPGAAGPARAETLWRPANGDTIRFDVLRQGNRFGEHRVDFNVGDDGRLEARTSVDLRAGIGPITVFRYDLEAVETWVDGELIALEGRCLDDGDRLEVEAQAVDDGLKVAGTAFSGVVAEPILPASHWNYAQTRQTQILSTEDGEIIEVEVVPLGRETIRAGGTEIEANKYLMDSDIDVTLWYDDTGRWLKLAFEARGQSIEYVLSELY